MNKRSVSPSKIASFLFALGCATIYAQNVGINATGASPHSSAILDVFSSSKGLLIPRMTTSQRNAIVTPALGLTIFNTDCNVYQYWNQISWKTIATIDMFETYSNVTYTFDYTGTIQTVVVPTSTTCSSECVIELWGAGGGGGGNDNNLGGTGGGGSYVRSVVSVNPGDVLQIYVGRGGLGGSSSVSNSGGGVGGWGYCNGGNGGNAGGSGNSGGGGGGGGASAVYNQTTGILYTVAAGGGGGGGAGNDGSTNGPGGNGGAGGQNGTSMASGTNGGTQSTNTTCAGANGISKGLGDGGGSGGGGGGYTNGGGSGTINLSSNDYGAGGGAGGNSLGQLIQLGSFTTPANSTDTDLCSGCARGGNIASNGGNGRVVIRFL